MQILFITLLISLLIQTLFFFFAYKLKTDKFTDLTYGLTFIIIATILLSISQKYNFQVLLFLMILFWGIRISGFLFIRVLTLKKDSRFDNIRDDFGKFFKFWMFQGLTVWIVMIPAIVLMSKNEYGMFGYMGLFGFIIWLVGLSLETTADIQKFIYKNIHKDKWVNVGLWRYARHPNYFGEMLVWWGIWSVGINHFKGFEFLTILGPLFISYLLLKVSGVPILEKKNKEIYGQNSEYKKYFESTNLLVPVSRRLFRDSFKKF